jgi:hypothetical protein
MFGDDNEVGNESIFIGKSAEEREERRVKLQEDRRKKLGGLSAVTQKLNAPTEPLVEDEAAA